MMMLDYLWILDLDLADVDVLYCNYHRYYYLKESKDKKELNCTFVLWLTFISIWAVASIFIGTLMAMMKVMMMIAIFTTLVFMIMVMIRIVRITTTGFFVR